MLNLFSEFLQKSAGGWSILLLVTESFLTRIWDSNLLYNAFWYLE